jgi:hypothetical protein
VPNPSSNKSIKATGNSPVLSAEAVTPAPYFNRYDGGKMQISELLSTMPWWYYVGLSLFSLYFAIRGVVSEIAKYAEAPFSKTQKVIIIYIQEFIFKIIFTVSACPDNRLPYIFLTKLFKRH